MLDPSEVTALVGIRELIVEAWRFVPDSTIGGRHAAVVLLDGSVEAALAACLSRFGDAAQESDTLPKLHERLLQASRGPRDRFPGWRDAARLRRIRNLTQHHQVTPDSSTLVGIAGNVIGYVESIIQETFNIRLTDIAITESIEDQRIKETLTDVQIEIDQGDEALALRKLREEFGRVRSLWDSVRERLFGGGFSAFDELALNRTIRDATADARDLASMAPFAPSLAEYVWFRRVIQSQEGTPRRQDLRRALNFVVSWVVRWESFERINRDFNDRDSIAYVIRPSNLEGGEPRWVEGPTVTDTGGAGSLQVMLRGAVAAGDGSPENQEQWTNAFHTASRNHKSPRGYSVWFDPLRSTLEIGPIATPEDAKTALVQADQLFDEVTEAFHEQVNRSAKERRDLEARRLAAAQLEQVLRVLTAADTELLTVDVNPRGTGRLISINGGVPQMLTQCKLDVGHFQFGEDGIVWVVPDDATDEQIIASASAVLDYVRREHDDEVSRQINRKQLLADCNAAVMEHLNTSRP